MSGPCHLNHRNQNGSNRLLDAFYRYWTSRYCRPPTIDCRSTIFKADVRREIQNQRLGCMDLMTPRQKDGTVRRRSTPSQVFPELGHYLSTVKKIIIKLNKYEVNPWNTRKRWALVGPAHCPVNTVIHHHILASLQSSIVALSKVSSHCRHHPPSRRIIASSMPL